MKLDESELAAEIEAPPEFGERSKRGGRAKVPRWADALSPPADFDPLEVVATDVFFGLVIAYRRVLVATGMKERERAKLLSQLSSQIVNAIPKRRLWLAEQAIRGEASALESHGPGPQMEPREDADHEDPGKPGDQPTSRPTARRGRPRAR